MASGAAIKKRCGVRISQPLLMVWTCRNNTCARLSTLCACVHVSVHVCVSVCRFCAHERACCMFANQSLSLRWRGSKHTPVCINAPPARTPEPGPYLSCGADRRAGPLALSDCLSLSAELLMLFLTERCSPCPPLHRYRCWGLSAVGQRPAR